MGGRREGGKENKTRARKGEKCVNWSRLKKMLADERHVKMTTKERIIEREQIASWFLAICKPLGRFTRLFVK